MDYDAATRLLLASAQHGRISLKAFRNAAAHIAEQLKQDSLSGCFSYWGQCVNFDEFEQQQIVDPKILSLLGRCAGYPIRDGRAYHAGLMHTYGYLFSVLKTRFGYKRQRWVSGVIEQGLGLPSGCCSPTPSAGTFLQNVTHLLSRVSFGPRHFSGSGQTPADSISAALQQRSSELVVSARLVEQPDLDELPVAVRKELDELMIHTDLLRFTAATQEDYGLLIYWTKQRTSRRLITCFPVSKSSWHDISQPSRQTESLVRPRFNLFLAGFPREGVSGIRTLTHFH